MQLVFCRAHGSTEPDVTAYSGQCGLGGLVAGHEAFDDEPGLGGVVAFAEVGEFVDEDLVDEAWGSWRVAQWMFIRGGPSEGRAEAQRKPRSRTSTLTNSLPRRAARGRILLRSHLVPTSVYQRRMAAAP